LIAVAVAAAAIAAHSGESPPATGASSLVPGDALAYVHVSTTSAHLANVELPLSQLFPAPTSGSGQVPEFADHLINGVTAHQLSLAPGLQIDYAVFRGLVVISTSLNRIGAVAARARSLADQPSYSAALANRPQRVSSLVFLDLNQLLRLAEQTGLFHGSRYQLLRPDLERVRTVGLTSTRGEADSTAELFLQIP
jgi:hypothetical protein